MSTEYPTWTYWRRATITPSMCVAVNFTAGTVYFYDEDIISYGMIYNAFDASSILCGALEPATATLIISDFDQTYNPILNNALAAGIRVDIYLGIHEYQIYAGYLSVSDGVLQIPYSLVSSKLIVSQHVLSTAPSTVFVVSNGLLNLYSMYDAYGRFYTTNWTYNTTDHAVEIELVNGIEDILNIDNREDAELHGLTNYPIWEGDDEGLLGNLLSTYTYLKGAGPALTVTEPYACYEERSVDCINNMCTASMAMVYYDQHDELYVQPYTGKVESYFTYTITDDDVFEYDITQTAVAAYDHAEVEYFEPSLESTIVKSLTTPSFSLGYNYVYLNTGRIFYVYALRHSNVDPDDVSATRFGTYTWTESYVRLYANPAYTFAGTFDIYAFTVGGNNIVHSLAGGSSAYSITNNIYIQSLSHAEDILDKLETFLSLPAAVIKITIRGCPAIWIGTQVHINSAKYHIDHMYTVIGISFYYDGAVETTYTLQYTLE